MSSMCYLFYVSHLPLTFYYHPAFLFFMCDGLIIFLLLIGFFDFDLVMVSAP